MEPGAAPSAAPDTVQRRDQWMLLAAGIGTALTASRVKYLLIKGAVPDVRGLREPKYSADLDVLVHPDDALAALATLGAWGWTTSVGSGGDTARAPHAETLVHKGWPVSIDLHHTFPGFTEGAARAFEVLWERRQPLDAAGCVVDAPDRLGTALVESLNAMRSGALGQSIDGSHGAGRAVIGALADDEALQLAELADSAGAAYAMAPVLGRPEARASKPDQLAWDLALAGAGPFEARAAADFSLSRGSARVVALARIVWPRRDEFVSTYGLDHASSFEVLGARFARLGRGLARLPRGLSRARALTQRSPRS
ncbi:nucleotidyltransferase family protein [Demequina sp. SYSU T00068]|uniref:nucleotidyltransferase family protein n=1 Tax=Demequina lignilytica TaxID=3051663 RepID=UPI00262B63DB|nr:nucleotidyltransferase family protein [Demequina sp. SYSU T00068]MDN4490645.1 nucleotidyltransferase family protein [Demequina sp. SYSU T00068]